MPVTSTWVQNYARTSLTSLVGAAYKLLPEKLLAVLLRRNPYLWDYVPDNGKFNPFDAFATPLGNVFGSLDEARVFYPLAFDLENQTVWHAAMQHSIVDASGDYEILIPAGVHHSGPHAITGQTAWTFTVGSSGKLLIEYPTLLVGHTVAVRPNQESAALPSGLNAGVKYYVVEVEPGPSGWIKLATTEGGAAVSFSGGSGSLAVFRIAPNETSIPATWDTPYFFPGPRIRGCGRNSIIISTAPNTTPIFDIGNGDANFLFISNPRVHDLDIRAAYGSTSALAGIRYEHCYFSETESVRVRNTVTAFQMRGRIGPSNADARSVSFATFRKCESDGAWDQACNIELTGAAYGSNVLTFENCRSSGCGLGGWEFHGLSVHWRGGGSNGDSVRVRTMLMSINAGSSTLEATGHGLSNGDQVLWLRPGPVEGIAYTDPDDLIQQHRPFWVINATSDTVQLAYSIGGSAVNFTGGAGQVYLNTGKGALASARAGSQGQHLTIEDTELDGVAGCAILADSCDGVSVIRANFSATPIISTGPTVADQKSWAGVIANDVNRLRVEDCIIRHGGAFGSDPLPYYEWVQIGATCSQAIIHNPSLVIWDAPTEGWPDPHIQPHVRLISDNGVNTQITFNNARRHDFRHVEAKQAHHINGAIAYGKDSGFFEFHPSAISGTCNTTADSAIVAVSFDPTTYAGISGASVEIVDAGTGDTLFLSSVVVDTGWTSSSITVTSPVPQTKTGVAIRLLQTVCGTPPPFGPYPTPGDPATRRLVTIVYLNNSGFTSLPWRLILGKDAANGANLGDQSREAEYHLANGEVLARTYCYEPTSEKWLCVSEAQPFRTRMQGFTSSQLADLQYKPPAGSTAFNRTTNEFLAHNDSEWKTLLTTDAAAAPSKLEIHSSGDIAAIDTLTYFRPSGDYSTYILSYNGSLDLLGFIPPATSTDGRKFTMVVKNLRATTDSLGGKLRLAFSSDNGWGMNADSPNLIEILAVDTGLPNQWSGTFQYSAHSTKWVLLDPTPIQPGHEKSIPVATPGGLLKSIEGFEFDDTTHKLSIPGTAELVGVVEGESGGRVKLGYSNIKYYLQSLHDADTAIAGAFRMLQGITVDAVEGFVEFLKFDTNGVLRLLGKSFGFSGAAPSGSTTDYPVGSVHIEGPTTGEDQEIHLRTESGWKATTYRPDKLTLPETGDVLLGASTSERLKKLAEVPTTGDWIIKAVEGVVQFTDAALAGAVRRLDPWDAEKAPTDTVFAGDADFWYVVRVNGITGWPADGVGEVRGLASATPAAFQEFRPQYGTDLWYWRKADGGGWTDWKSLLDIEHANQLTVEAPSGQETLLDVKASSGTNPISRWFNASGVLKGLIDIVGILRFEKAVFGGEGEAVADVTTGSIRAGTYSSTAWTGNRPLISVVGGGGVTEIGNGKIKLTDANHVEVPTLGVTGSDGTKLVNLGEQLPVGKGGTGVSTMGALATAVIDALLSDTIPQAKVDHMLYDLGVIRDRLDTIEAFLTGTGTGTLTDLLAGKASQADMSAAQGDITANTTEIARVAGSLSDYALVGHTHAP